MSARPAPPPAQGPAAGLADREAARIALERCAPMLDAMARDAGVNQSGVLHVVVLDPLAEPGHAGFDQAVLAERSFGKPREQWDADYAGFARAKAGLSWRTRCDSHALQSLAPQRVQPGESTLWGSVWLDGIVVAVSGCEAAYDEAAAGAVALMLRAHCKQAMAVCTTTTLEPRRP